MALIILILGKFKLICSVLCQDATCRVAWPGNEDTTTNNIYNNKNTCGDGETAKQGSAIISHRFM